MWTSSRKRLRRLEAAWRQPAARAPFLPLVARYYHHVQHEPAYYRLPDTKGGLHSLESMAHKASF